MAIIEAVTQPLPWQHQMFVDTRELNFELKNCCEKCKIQNAISRAYSNNTTRDLNKILHYYSTFLPCMWHFITFKMHKTNSESTTQCLGHFNSCVK